MSTKYCYTCQAEKEVTEFAKNSSRKDGLQSKCKACRKKAWKSEYENNSRYYIEKRKKQAKDSQVWLQEYKKKLECKICKEKAVCCLSFHHIDPKRKENNISTIQYWSRDRRLKEIEKCVCLCENCHRKLHTGLIKLQL